MAGNRPTSGKSLFGELREVIWLSLPIIITMTSHTLMQAVDAAMLGRYGHLELAAVIPAGLVFFTFASFLIGIISCNNTFVSQSLGRGLPQDCARYTIHAVYLALLAQFVMFPLIAWAKHLFAFFGHEPQVQALEVTYFGIRAMQLAGTGMIIALSTFFQGTGRPVIPMLTGIAANTLNILGDYVLIFGKFGFPEWGIFGAGLATTLATYVEVMLLMWVFLSGRMNREFGTRRWRPFEWARLQRLLRVGIWTAATFFLDLASWTIFINVLVGKLGTNVLAGNAAASQIMHLSFMPTIGLNIGVTAMVGRHIGQGDIRGAKRRGYLGIACGCSYMTVMGIIFFIFRRPLIMLFSQEPAVITAGSIILVYVALFQFSDAFNILSRGALKGAGDTRFPAVVQIVIAWFFFLPLASYLGRPDVWGIHGAWISATVYVWVLAPILFWRFVNEGWRKINIFR